MEWSQKSVRKYVKKMGQKKNIQNCMIYAVLYFTGYSSDYNTKRENQPVSRKAGVLGIFGDTKYCP